MIALGLSASYVLARYRFRGRGLMFGLFAAGLMFPITVAITPLFILLNNLHLTDHLIGVILPQVAFGLPTTIIILVPFLRAIPDEIEEAAAVDGCSRLRFYFRMVLPLSLPGVLTTGILTFVASWNSYLLPLFVLSNTESFTLPLGVQQFRGVHGSDTAAVLATFPAASPGPLVGHVVGSGHFVQLEVPEQLNPMLDLFLDTLDGGTA